MTGVVTVTASAAIDRTYRVAEFEHGGVNRATAVHDELSGKGVNVAGAIAQTAVPVRAVVPLGAGERARYGGAPYLVPVPMEREVRINVSLIEGDGTSTKINQQPSDLSRDEWEDLVDTSLRCLEEVGGGWLALCGSLPELAGSGELVPFESLLERAAAAGAKVAADLSGEPLRRIIERGPRVDLIKPNTHELAEAVDEELRTVGDVVGAAERLREGGIGTVYVSMGADGALVVGEGGYRLASAVAPSLTNTVGAGDASLAGFLTRMAAGGDDILDRAAETAASWGALGVSQRTTMLADPETAPFATLSVPSLDTVLTEPGLVAR